MQSAVKPAARPSVEFVPPLTQQCADCGGWSVETPTGKCYKCAGLMQCDPCKDCYRLADACVGCEHAKGRRG